MKIKLSKNNYTLKNVKVNSLFSIKPIIYKNIFKTSNLIDKYESFVIK